MKSVITIIIVALLIGGGGTFLWVYYGGFEGEQGKAVAFINYYGDYAEVAERVEQQVHLPGTEQNTNRAELYSLLDSILTKKMIPRERESLAHLASTNLAVLKDEIDSAQIGQAKLYDVLQYLDNASRVFSSIDLNNRATEIVALARKRAEISAHITSLLSESNEQTQEIISRILIDKGELTQAHIVELNASTEEAERRFGVLEGLYLELIAKKEEIEIAFKNFIEVSL